MGALAPLLVTTARLCWQHQELPLPHTQLLPLSPELMTVTFSLETSFPGQASALRPLQPWAAAAEQSKDGGQVLPDPKYQANLLPISAAEPGPLGWLLSPAPLSPLRSCFPWILLSTLKGPNNHSNIPNTHIIFSYNGSGPTPPFIKSSPWPSTLGQAKRTHRRNILCGISFIIIIF